MSNDVVPSNSKDFSEVITIIETARENTFRAANRELIDMYWRIGEFVSRKVSENNWGKSVVKEFSDYIQSYYSGISGFSASNIWRMKQFYETYCDNEKLATLLRELAWSHNMQIMSCETDVEREFYITLSIKNRYSFRELKRQMDSGLYERAMLSDIINKDVIAKGDGLAPLRDSYILEFLSLPENFQEKDLRKAIASNLKKFILELGKDFTFVEEHFRVQVGNRDFYIDLLFHNRELRCLVAIELKILRYIVMFLLFITKYGMFTQISNVIGQD